VDAGRAHLLDQGRSHGGSLGCGWIIASSFPLLFTPVLLVSERSEVWGGPVAGSSLLLPSPGCQTNRATEAARGKASASAPRPSPARVADRVSEGVCGWPGASLPMPSSSCRTG